MGKVIKNPTVFCDIDGTIFKYRKFDTYLTTEPEVLPGVKESMHSWLNSGVYIVLTTARPESLRDHTVEELNHAWSTISSACYGNRKRFEIPYK